MEKTELREAFFEEAKNDPWLHTLQRMWADAWVQGYEEAFRRMGLQNHVGRYELLHDAIEDLTSRQKKLEAEYLISIANLAKVVPVETLRLTGLT